MCEKNGVQIKLDQEVKSIKRENGLVTIVCKNGNKYQANKVVVTLSLATIPSLNFEPRIPEKIKAIEKMGFGNIIKFLF